MKSLCLALLLLVALAPATHAATDLSFDTGPGEVACNDEIWIDVVVDAGAVDLRGLSIEVSIDPTLVEYVDFAAGTLFDDAPCDPFLYGIDQGGGEALIDVAGLGCSVNGAGSVARILLRGLANGVSPLQGLAATLRTSTNASIAATWTDGSLLVSCPIENDAPSLGTLKGRYR